MVIRSNPYDRKNSKQEYYGSSTAKKTTNIRYKNYQKSENAPLFLDNFMIQFILYTLSRLQVLATKYIKQFDEITNNYGSWNFFVAYLRRRLITIEKYPRNLLHPSGVRKILMIVFYRYLPSTMAFHKKS